MKSKTSCIQRVGRVLSAGIVLILGFLFTTVLPAQTTQPTPLTVEGVPSPIRIDGHLSEWPTARMILLNRPSQVTLGKVYWKGEDDFSARIFLTYDDQFLYLAAIIQKPGGNPYLSPNSSYPGQGISPTASNSVHVVNQGSGLSLWNGDCLEFYISTDASIQDRQKLSRGDYRIAISPGTDCKSPKLYCLNLDREIQGGRITARLTKAGYILEAGIPWAFFEGMELGPGKTSAINLVINEGGLNGNRCVQLDMTGDPDSWENPLLWTEVQWNGPAKASIPFGKNEDLNAELVRDGTSGATFLGTRKITGIVLGPEGKPIAGAKITTWPRTQKTLTDSNGSFNTEGIRVYDLTVIYARKNGFACSLCPLPAKHKPATLLLSPLSEDMIPKKGVSNPTYYGMALSSRNLEWFEKNTQATADWIKTSGIKMLRLEGIETTSGTLEQQHQVLEDFVVFARSIGAEPVLGVRAGFPDEAADWVKFCNLKKLNIKFWTVGDEPDLYEKKVPNPAYNNYTAYDYINDFRADFNAMKLQDPSIFVLGPELAFKYSRPQEDWLRPFLRYDGDIIDMVSLHRYGATDNSNLTVKLMGTLLRAEPILLKELRDVVYENTDVYVPLLVTGGNLCAVGVTNRQPDFIDPQGIWGGLWEANEMALLSEEGFNMGLFTRLRGGDGMEYIGEKGPNPAYWVLKMIANHFSGRIIPAQTQMANLTVFARQNPQNRNVVLLLVNEGDRYCHPRISLNGEEADVVVEAGLKQYLDYEVPYYSVACLILHADHTPGVAELYTSKMAKQGLPSQTTVLKP